MQTRRHSGAAGTVLLLLCSSIVPGSILSSDLMLAGELAILNCPKVYVSVWMCVHGVLWWTGVSFRVYTQPPSPTPSVPGIATLMESESNVTLTSIIQLLYMNEKRVNNASLLWYVSGPPVCFNIYFTEGSNVAFLSLQLGILYSSAVARKKEVPYNVFDPFKSNYLPSLRNLA